MEQSVPKRRNIKFRRQRINQKKAYNIQNTAKVWNQEKRPFDSEVKDARTVAYCHSYVFTVPYRDSPIYTNGPGSSVGAATDYKLDGPGIECLWGRDFPPVQTGPGAHPASCTMGTESFRGVKSSRGVLLTPHLLLAPRSWKSRAIPLPPSGPQPAL